MGTFSTPKKSKSSDIFSDQNTDFSLYYADGDEELLKY